MRVSFPSPAGARSKTSRTPTMLGASSFSGPHSFRLLEVTVVASAPAWQRRAPDHMAWEITAFVSPSAWFLKCPAPQAPCLLVLHETGPGHLGPSLGTSAAQGSLALSGPPWLAWPMPRAPGMLVRSTVVPDTAGFKEVLQCLSSLCQQELLEALSTPEQRLILG